MFDDVLGVYYAKARVYDHNNKHFGTEDLAKGFVDEPFTLNSYLYTINNPLIYLDEDSQKPTPLEAALMTRHVYNPSHYVGTLDDRWHHLPQYSNLGSGIAVYGRFLPGFPQDRYGRFIREYTVAFRGTRFGEEGGVDDMVQNIQQHLPRNITNTFNITSQNQIDDREFMDYFLNKKPNRTITLTDHSKGGGSAFNPSNPKALTSDFLPPLADTILSHRQRVTSEITSFVVEGDILRSLLGEPPVATTRLLERQHTTELIPMPRIADPSMVQGIHTVNMQRFLIDSVNNHRMSSVIQALGGE